MPIIDTKTGKVLVTDKQLIKDLKKWIASFTHDEFSKMLKEEIKESEVNNGENNKNKSR